MKNGSGIAFAATDNSMEYVVVHSYTPPSVAGKPLIAVRMLDVSTMTPAARDVRPGDQVLATGSTFGTVTDVIVPASIATGDPELKIASWSAPLSSVSTFTSGAALGAGHARTVVWFGSPTVDGGPGTLRAIWYSDL